MNNSSPQLENLEQPAVVEFERELWDVFSTARHGSDLSFGEFLKLTLGLIFLAYLNEQSGSSGESQKQRIKISTESGWKHLLSVSEHDIGQAVNQAINSIEKLNGQLSEISYADYSRVDGSTLRSLIHSLHDVSKTVEESGFAEFFESLLHRAARETGMKTGAFCTPTAVSKLMVELVDPRGGMTIYDPCAGVADFLQETIHHIEANESNATQFKLYGQEPNRENYSLGKMKLAMNGSYDADLRLGNTLLDPQHITSTGMVQFDRVISKPQFALKLGKGELEQDKHNRFEYGGISRNADFAFIQHMIASLKPDGVMAVVTTHEILFRGGREAKIRQRILDDDLIEAIIGLPPSIFYDTRISTVILVINKNKPPGRVGKILFINADKEFDKDRNRNLLREENIARILSTFRQYKEIERFSKVASRVEIQANSFNLNITRYADSSPLAGLVTQYDSFKKYTVNDLSIEINSTLRGRKFKDQSNAVYIYRTGSKVTACLQELEGKHDRYYQVILKENALNRYVAQFLGTSVGQHALSVLMSGTTISFLRKSDLAECNIALPTLETQRSIIETHAKLSLLKREIDAIDRELSLNPKGLDEFHKQLDSMLEVVGQLSEADHIRGLIRKDESKTVEFKETFSHDLRKNERAKYIEESSLKTVVAFLNSDGGTLLVGVSDESRINGVDFEIKKYHKNNPDKFLLHFKNLLRSKIGEAFYPLISYDLIKVEGRRVLLVVCRASDRPCFMDDKIFYVRTNPATDKLEGTKQYEYIKTRFGI